MMYADRSNKNAFDVIRLMLAILVVLEHSFFVVENSFRNDPLYIYSGGQTNFGQFAVLMFFSISGYLVTQSFVRSGSFTEFMIRRIGRIVPGFLVASLVGLLVVGPVGSASGIDYFKAQNWIVLSANMLALKQANPAGVFPDLPLHLVHGTLWSIRYEFDCYILIGLLGTAGIFRTERVAAAYCGFAIVLATAALLQSSIPVVEYGPMALLISSPHQWPLLFSFFFSGSALWVFRKQLPLSIGRGVLAAACVVASLKTGGAILILLFAGSYAILAAAVCLSGEVRLGGARVDLSYGVYLYGWPVQQLWLHVLGPHTSPWLIFGLALPPTIVAAIVSWYGIERPGIALIRSRLGKAEPSELPATDLPRPAG